MDWKKEQEIMDFQIILGQHLHHPNFAMNIREVLNLCPDCYIIGEPSNETCLFEEIRVRWLSDVATPPMPVDWKKEGF